VALIGIGGVAAWRSSRHHQARRRSALGVILGAHHRGGKRRRKLAARSLAASSLGGGGSAHRSRIIAAAASAHLIGARAGAALGVISAYLAAAQWLALGARRRLARHRAHRGSNIASSRRVIVAASGIKARRRIFGAVGGISAAAVGAGGVMALIIGISGISASAALGARRLGVSCGEMAAAASRRGEIMKRRRHRGLGGENITSASRLGASSALGARRSAA